MAGDPGGWRPGRFVRNTLSPEDIRDIQKIPSQGEVEATYSGVTLTCVAYLNPESARTDKLGYRS